METHYLVAEVDRTALEWDFMWNALIEEGRERNLRAKALTTNSDDHNLLQEIILENEQALAQGALKVCAGNIHRLPWFTPFPDGDGRPNRDL